MGAAEIFLDRTRQIDFALMAAGGPALLKENLMNVDDILSVHEMVLDDVEISLIFESEEFQRLKQDVSGTDSHVLTMIVIRASEILSEM